MITRSKCKIIENGRHLCNIECAKDFNLTIKNLETRDLCIFPSSLFHHTIPFESTEERICFVFDLIQK